MPMPLEMDRALRDRGWSYFRSSTRDRVVPATGGSAHLSRIKIGEAYPVVEARGAGAVSLDERAAIAEEKLAAFKRLPTGEDLPLGVMQYFTAVLLNTIAGAVNGVPTDERLLLGIVPFDGWLREVILDGSGGDVQGSRVAIRTSGGGTFFKGASQAGLGLNAQFCEPDFFPLDARGTGNFRNPLRGGKVPVFSGDQVFAVLRNTNGVGALTQKVQVVVGIEAVVTGNPGSRAALAQYGALVSRSRESSAGAERDAARLAIEQERTRRTEIEGAAALQLAETRGTLALELMRAAPAPAPPRVARPPAEPPAGAGKTFVSSWMPQAGAIGYLVPDPPRGGKVNVFDNKYSVFDITGKLVSQGTIEVIRSDAQIPPGARLSSQRSVAGAGGLLLSAAQERLLLGGG